MTPDSRNWELCQDHWMQEEAYSSYLSTSCSKSAKFLHWRWEFCHHYCWASLFDLKNCTKCMKFNRYMMCFHVVIGECNFGNLIMGKDTRSDRTRSVWLTTEQQPTAAAMTSQCGCVIDYTICNSHVQTVTAARHRHHPFAPLIK